LNEIGIKGQAASQVFVSDSNVYGNSTEWAQATNALVTSWGDNAAQTAAPNGTIIKR